MVLCLTQSGLAAMLMASLIAASPEQLQQPNYGEEGLEDVELHEAFFSVMRTEGETCGRGNAACDLALIQRRAHASSGQLSQCNIQGSIEWHSGSSCYEVSKGDDYSLSLRGCKNTDNMQQWSNDDCGHISTRSFAGEWVDYWDGPLTQDQTVVSHIEGQLAWLPNTGNSVPCDRGMKLSFEPCPEVDFSSFPVEGCASAPSGAFQIKASSGLCVTVRKSHADYGIQPEHPYYFALAPCQTGNSSQEFIYRYMGCD